MCTKHKRGKITTKQWFPTCNNMSAPQKAPSAQEVHLEEEVPGVKKFILHKEYLVLKKSLL